jgi:hypothetical protein
MRTGTRCRGSCRRDAVDDQLVRHVLGYRFAGGFERDAVALADREGGQLAQFAEAVAQRINLVTAGDREPVGAVCAICLMGGGLPYGDRRLSLGVIGRACSRKVTLRN